MTKKKIVIGSDHGGFFLKEKIVRFLKKKGFAVKDIGTFSRDSVDYPDTAYQAAVMVAKNKSCRGLLICKSGIGNSIVANKVIGVRAALCHDLKSARMSRQHNDANILVLGALFVREPLAKKMIDVWLSTPFEGGRHLRRLKKIERIEKTCVRP